MTTILTFAPLAGQLPVAHLVIGEKELLDLSTNKALAAVLPAALPATASDALFYDLGVSDTPAKGASVASHYLTDGNKRSQVTFATLTTEKSRHNAVIRADAVQDLVSKHSNGEGDLHIVVCLKSAEQAFAAGMAIARAFPLYSKKTGKTKPQRTIQVEFVTTGTVDYQRIQISAEAVRYAAKLTDMPTSELHTDAYLEEVQAIYERLKDKGVQLLVKKGETLRDEGFGGLWGVGKAAEHLPALVVLTYTPKSYEKTVVWAGKGIVYDTGGLSIKGKDNMPTMKCDMGGSAAVLAAFEAVVKLGCPHQLHCMLCLAENSVDAKSTRPDDILYMYSGKTVEVNNTDAEGRLVLADGVAYATKHLNPDIVMDLATLTGAQSYATGKLHSGVLANDEQLESVVVQAGKRSGDLVFPLIYAPEYLGIPKQFASEVADMKNSVKDRANASSSCAGHFIEEHMVGDKWKWNSDVPNKGKWAHLDIAAPAFVNGRGTGYGAALLIEVLKHL